MGANHSLIRFGAITHLHDQKRQLFYYALKNGLLLSGLLIAGTWLAIPLVTKNLPGAQSFLFILSIQLITLLVFENIKSYFRILRLNKPFALSQVVSSTLLLVFSLLGIYIAGGEGYAWAIVIAPLIGGLLLFFKLPHALRRLSWSTKSRPAGFWKYGFFAGLGGITSQLLYTIDIVLLGNLQSDPGIVAQYKVASIIPLSLMLIPLAFINTDYAKIASNYENVSYLKYYASHYLQIFAIVAVIMVTVLYMASGFLLSTFFGNTYSDGAILLQVFSLGLVGGILFRVPFGNILSALGKANWNSVIAVFVLIGNVLLDYFFIKWYGAIGAAIATSAIIWLSGLLAFLAFHFYLRSVSKRRL